MWSLDDVNLVGLSKLLNKQLSGNGSWIEKPWSSCDVTMNAWKMKLGMLSFGIIWLQTSLSWLFTLQWRHNECDGISNHQPQDCLRNPLLWHRKHKSSASLAFVQGIYRSPVNSLHKWPVMWKMFPFDDFIMMPITLWWSNNELIGSWGCDSDLKSGIFPHILFINILNIPCKSIVH